MYMYISDVHVHLLLHYYLLLRTNNERTGYKNVFGSGKNNDRIHTA